MTEVEFGDNRLPDRFWRRISIDPAAGCWMWAAPLDRYGYGHAYLDGKGYLAHRVIYDVLRSHISAGLELDHLCRVRNCVNPDHLEPVSHRVNVQRGELGQPRARCPKGHEYSESNSYRSASSGLRCKTCIRNIRWAYRGRMRDAQRKYRARKRSESYLSAGVPVIVSNAPAE